ncbi:MULTISPECIES: hypothetical protein [unclassified Bradyrhizobium]|uniref:hypothetical protein n=1 Tax=unclassified Bradyrhizobium TaxID=2631580 RepID=UPI0003F811DC|nr:MULTISPECIES: hypothetical protein [unclassified Bradyrhizobium]MCK7669346.1 hypothetical protein [Bradyrhizobium sp. 2S1]
MISQEYAQRLLGIVQAFVNPVQEHHGIPCRIDMNCLRSDGAKLLEEINNGKGRR